MITATAYARNSRAPLSLCACGCGDFAGRTREGRPNQYLRGHCRRGKSPSEQHRKRLSNAMKGKPGHWLGKKIPDEARRKMSASGKLKKLTAEHKRKIGLAGIGRRHPESQLAKARGRKASLETRRKQSDAQRGAKGSNWKGGVSVENALLRASTEYRIWREAVMSRDAFTCQKCGDKAHKGRGSRVDLHAHHIKPFADFPDLRFVVSNGLTVCRDCHEIIHGRKIPTPPTMPVGQIRNGRTLPVLQPEPTSLFG